VTDLRPEALLDCATLARELNITRHAAEQIMRHVPKVHPDGVRKVYVRWGDVQRYLAECTRVA